MLWRFLSAKCAGPCSWLSEPDSIIWSSGSSSLVLSTKHLWSRGYHGKYKEVQGFENAMLSGWIVCKHLCEETGGNYFVAIAESHFKEIVVVSISAHLEWQRRGFQLRHECWATWNYIGNALWIWINSYSRFDRNERLSPLSGILLQKLKTGTDTIL